MHLFEIFLPIKKKERIAPSPFPYAVCLTVLSFCMVWHSLIFTIVMLLIKFVFLFLKYEWSNPGLFTHQARPVPLSYNPQSCSTEAASFVLTLKSRLALNVQYFHCPNIWDNRTAALVLDGFVYVQYYDLFFWQWLLSSFFIYLVPVIW